MPTRSGTISFTAGTKGGCLAWRSTTLALGNWIARVGCLWLSVLTLLVVASGATLAFAAEPAPGFWAGYVDGFLSLLKLVVSPVMEVTLVSEAFGQWGYSLGYYLGLLTFAGLAGALASRESGNEEEEVRWG